MTEAAERMSRVDTAWLRMDNDVNLMMIVGVWLLEPGITLRGAVRAHRGQAAQVRRASARRSCTTRSARTGSIDDDFDIARHVVREKLARKRGQSERAALQRACRRTRDARRSTRRIRCGSST